MVEEKDWPNWMSVAVLCARQNDVIKCKIPKCVSHVGCCSDILRFSCFMLNQLHAQF